MALKCADLNIPMTADSGGESDDGGDGEDIGDEQV